MKVTQNNLPVLYTMNKVGQLNKEMTMGLKDNTLYWYQTYMHRKHYEFGISFLINRFDFLLVSFTQ